MKRKTHYLNTDLDLIAPLDLAPLADALGERGLQVFHVLAHEDGTWSTRFETNESFEGPDANIAAMLSAIEALGEPARRLWAACTVRTFDIGYSCGDGPRAFNQELSAATLVRVAAAGASVVITLYPELESDAARAAVQILRKDKSIKSRIGKFTGHGYGIIDSPVLKQKQAEVQVSLSGKKAVVRVHCIMERNEQEAWELKEIIKREEWKVPDPAKKADP